jgi:Zn-dependent M28 family amino/carboxypeptidase
MQVDPERLKQHLKVVARPRCPWTDPKGYQEVSFYIKQTLAGWDYAVKEEPFSFDGETFSNLVAQRGGASGDFIVGAHFDAVEGSPGADDNASGVAALLELARVFSKHPAVQRVQFAAFTLEEWGMVGSTHYVASLKRARVPLTGMLSLEMLGFTHPRQSYPLGLAPFYPRQGNFIGVGANWRSRGLLRSFVKGMRKVSDLPVESITLPGDGGLVPAIRLSDHSPFWDAGYPALIVTDTSFYRNPHYHTASDTIETLDLPFLTRVTQGVLEGIFEALK